MRVKYKMGLPREVKDGENCSPIKFFEYPIWCIPCNILLVIFRAILIYFICRELHQFNEFYEHMIVKKEDEEWTKLVVYLIFYTNRMKRKLKKLLFNY